MNQFYDQMFKSDLCESELLSIDSIADDVAVSARPKCRGSKGCKSNI